MSDLHVYISLGLALVAFATGVRQFRAHQESPIEKAANVLLVPIFAPATLGAFDSLGAASSIQLLTFVAGVLGILGAALSLATFPPLHRKKWPGRSAASGYESRSDWRCTLPLTYGRQGPSSTTPLRR